ncbi:DUF6350 family protein [Rhodococcus sp. 27YEA15]|uniref:cell division protein PerM n=1 Tax=Rhodococcus sp. 27YEA15 TaxID=3156259 RepID=UPI003C7B0F87
MAFRTSGLTLLVISAVVVFTLISVSSDLAGLLGAIGAVWLAVHQVPVTVDGVDLGVLPMLPTAVLMWTVARRCASSASAADTRQDSLRLIGAAIAGPLTVTAIALAVIADISGAIPLSSPDALLALGWVIGIHLVSATVGVLAAHWDGVVAVVPPWVAAAVRPGAAISAALLAAGAVTVAVSLVYSYSTVGELLERGNGFVGGLGLTVLSVLYLPNLVVGAAAVLTGASADLGAVSINVFGNIGGDLPPLPLLGAVPAGVGGGVWPILLLVPAAIGVWLGRYCARAVGGQDSVLTVLAASAGAGIVMAALALTSGGDLGRFGAVEVPWWAFGLLTFAWLGLFGAATAVIVAWIAHRDEHAAEDEPAEEIEPEDEPTATQPTATQPTAALEERRDETRERVALEAEIVDDTPETPVQEPTAVVDDVEVVDAEVIDPSTTEGTDEGDLPSHAEKPSD